MHLKLTLCIVVAAAIQSGFTQEAYPVHIHVSARDLPSSDPSIGSPDAYVVVSYSSGGSGFVAVRNTSVIIDQINPNWTEVFTFFFFPGASQRLRLEIWDEDLEDSDDYIGDVSISLEEMKLAPNDTLVKPIQPAGNGNLILRNFCC